MNLFNSINIAALAKFFGRFKRKEDGLITVEAVLMVPLLFWSLWASFSFFDSYRQSSRNLKAAYAVADVISRERSTVNVTYFNSLFSLMETMVAERSDMSMRVSFLRFDQPDDRHYVLWSCVRGAKYTKWNDGNIDQIRAALPQMPNDGKMIVVETSNTYRRPYKIGFGSPEYPMDNFVFTHPRVFDNINIEDPDNC